MNVALSSDVMSGLLENVFEEVALEEDLKVEEPNLSDAELNLIAAQNELELKQWNIVRCSACRTNFDMLRCKYAEGNLICPKCMTIN